MRAIRSSLCLAGLLATQSARAVGATEPSRPPHPAWELGAAFGIVRATGSAFDATLRGYGFNGLALLPYGALEFRRRVRPWLHVGGRVGIIGMDGGRSPADGAALTLVIPDAGVALRALWEHGNGSIAVRIGGQIDLGVAIGVMNYRRVDQVVPVPRAAAVGVVGLSWSGGFVDFEFGAQYVPWAGAAGSSFDPAFAGALFALELGAAL